MTPRPVGKDDINAVFQRNDGTLWRLVAYAEQPTVTFEEVAPSGRRGEHAQASCVVESPLAREFTRLVPEASS